MKSESIFSRQWDRTKQIPDPTPTEIKERTHLINLVRGCWDDDLQDQVFIQDSPEAAVALDLVMRYGVLRAGRMITKMNGDDDGD